MRRLAAASLALLSLAAGACAPAAASDAGEAAAAAAAAPQVGGAPSLDSALADFRAPLPVVTRLEGGAHSLDALVTRFVRAVERVDGDELRTIVVDRAEWAYLYYPGSVFTRRPTRQAAPLAWFLNVTESQKGLNRALDRFGGRPLGYVGHRCDPQPTLDGASRIWTGCVLRLAPAGGDTTELHLFGPVLERDGAFKLYSYKNDL